MNVPKELVKNLLKLFPTPTIKPLIPHDEIMYRAGQHSVIQFLQHQIEQQEKESKPN